MASDHPNLLSLQAQPHLEPDAQAQAQAQAKAQAEAQAKAQAKAEAEAEAKVHPDACFDANWLALRRTADSAARAPELEAHAADWLRQRRMATAPARPLRLLDLGSGSGANPCHLAPRLPGLQQWTLIDHDAGLLARAQAACAGLHDADGGSVDVITRCLDLARIDAHMLAGADLVCASALLDLVDAAWLDRLADACTAAGSALLVTLSVDGNWRFVPDAASAMAAPARAATVQTADEATRSITDHAIDAASDDVIDAVADDTIDPAADDDFVRTAFNAHQRRDKGLGAALGPDAAPALATCLEKRGFQVRLALSPWRLRLADPAQAALARALIDGWRDAACAQAPDASARIAAWHARRIAACGPDDGSRHGSDRGSNRSPGGGTLEVGHIDLFAAPPRNAR